MEEKVKRDLLKVNRFFVQVNRFLFNVTRQFYRDLSVTLLS